MSGFIVAGVKIPHDRARGQHAGTRTQRLEHAKPIKTWMSGAKASPRLPTVKIARTA